MMFAAPYYPSKFLEVNKGQFSRRGSRSGLTSAPPSGVCEGGRVWARLPEGVYTLGVVSHVESKLQIRLDDGDLVTCNGCDVTSYVPDVSPHPLYIRPGARVLLPDKGNYCRLCGTVVEVNHSAAESVFLVQLDDGEEVWEEGRRLRLLGGCSPSRKSSDLQEGEKVLAKWWDGLYYEACITGVADMIEVTFDSNDVVRRHPLDKTAAVRDSAPDPSVVCRGSRVIAQSSGDCIYYPGTVTKIDAPRFLVLFDIGDEEWKKTEELRLLFSSPVCVIPGSVYYEDVHEDMMAELDRVCAELEQSLKHSNAMNFEFSGSTSEKRVVLDRESLEEPKPTPGLDRKTFTTSHFESEQSSLPSIVVTPSEERSVLDRESVDKPEGYGLDTMESTAYPVVTESPKTPSADVIEFPISHCETRTNETKDIRVPDDDTVFLDNHDEDTTSPEPPVSIYEEITAANQDSSGQERKRARPCSEDWSETDSLHSWHSAREPASSMDSLLQSVESYHSAESVCIADLSTLANRGSDSYDEKLDSLNSQSSRKWPVALWERDTDKEEKHYHVTQEITEIVEKQVTVETVLYLDKKKVEKETFRCNCEQAQSKDEVLESCESAREATDLLEEKQSTPSCSDSEARMDSTEYFDGFVNIDCTSIDSLRSDEIFSEIPKILREEMRMPQGFQKILSAFKRKKSKGVSLDEEDWVLVQLDKIDFELSEARRAIITRKIHSQLEPDCCIMM